MIAGRASDPWFSIPAPKAAARLRLFCFPYAGGGASAYFSWSRALAGEAVEVVAVQPPGRENRLREAPFRDLASLVGSLDEAIGPRLDRPFAFFGHSMGALVAFELARTLAARRGPGPSHLFVSGAHAPDVPREEAPLHPIVDDERFVEAVASRYGGIPSIVLENAELRGVILPALRADMAITESYTYEDAPPLACAISAYGGTRDPLVREDRLARWRDRTAGGFSCQLFEGDHFFLGDARGAVLDDMTPRLKRYF